MIAREVNFVKITVEYQYQKVSKMEEETGKLGE